MKKSSKIVLTTCITLIVVGLIICSMGLAFGARSIENARSNNWDERLIESTETLQPFDKVRIDASVFDLTIQPGSANTIEYRCYDEKPQIKVENGELTVKARYESKRRENRNFFDWIVSNSFPFNWLGGSHNREDQQIILTIAKPQLEAMNVNLSVGYIDIRDINVKSLIVDGSIGDVNLSGITADEAVVGVSTANMELFDCAIGDLQLNCSIGDLESKRLTTNKLDVDFSTGSVNLSGTFRGKTRVQGSIGDANIDTTLPESSYYVDANTSIGEVHVGGRTRDSMPNADIVIGDESAPNSMRVSNTTGDVRITFDN